MNSAEGVVIVTGPPASAVTTIFDAPDAAGDDRSWQAAVTSAQANARHASIERKQDVWRMNSVLPSKCARLCEGPSGDYTSFESSPASVIGGAAILAMPFGSSTGEDARATIQTGPLLKGRTPAAPIVM